MIEVTAGILFQGEKVLIARRAAGKHLTGFWEFPGGKIESGETSEASLVREFAEEFNVEIAVEVFFMHTVYAYPEKTVRLHAYRVRHVSGQFHLTDHDALAWVQLSDLLTYPLAPADVPIAEALVQEWANQH